MSQDKTSSQNQKQGNRSRLLGWIVLFGLIVLLAIPFMVPQLRALLFLAKGDIDTSLGNKNGALDDYQNALNADEKNDDVLRKAGLALHDAGKDDQAYDCFRLLYTNEKQKYIAIPYLVAFELKRKAAPVALKYAQEWVQHDPNSAEAYDGRGLAYEQLQKMDQALDDFNKSAQLNPTGPAAEDRDDLLQKQREWKRMTQGIFDPKLETDNNDYDALIRNARKLFRGYSWDQALAMTDQAIKLNPKSPAAYYVRASILRENNRHKESVDNLLIVQRLSGGNVFKLPKLEDEPIDQADLRCNVHPARVWLNLAWCYSGMGNKSEAMKCINKSIECDPDAINYFSGQAYLLRSQLDHQAGNDKQAKADNARSNFIHSKLPPPPEQSEGFVTQDWF